MESQTNNDVIYKMFKDESSNKAKEGMDMKTEGEVSPWKTILECPSDEVIKCVTEVSETPRKKCVSSFTGGNNISSLLHKMDDIRVKLSIQYSLQQESRVLSFYHHCPCIHS